MSMTFTLFEWVKDNLDDLLTQQPEAAAPVQVHLSKGFYLII